MNSAYPNQRAAETPGNRTAEPATPAQAKTDGPDYDFEKDLQRHTDDSAEPEEQRVRLSIAKRIAKRIHDLRRSNPTITSAKMRHALLNEGFADDSIANHVNVPAIALKQGYLVQTVISCEKVLERLCVYYQRGGELVKPVLGKDADFAASTAIRRHPESVVIQPATFTSVQWELAHSGRFIKYIRSGAGF